MHVKTKAGMKMSGSDFHDSLIYDDDIDDDEAMTTTKLED
jgi:hypothetical protein